MSKINFLSYENNFLNKFDLQGKTNISIETLMSLIKNSEDRNLKEVFSYISIVKFESTQEEFDEISLKIFNKANELYKELMSIVKNNDTNSVLFINLEAINYFLASFFKNFHENYQNYNEKHKNLIKIIPNCLKVYFKLFEENHEMLISHSSTMKSFLVNIISQIKNFPLLMRPYENKLDSIFKNILSHHSVSDDIVGILTMSYALFIRLSPDLTTKLSLIVTRVQSNLNYFLKVFTPKTLKNVKTKTDNTTANELLTSIFNYTEKELKSLSLDQSNRIIKILFSILKNVFRSIPVNSSIDVDLSGIFNIIQSILSNLLADKDLSVNDIVLEGLQIREYRLFKQYTFFKALKMFNFMLVNYSKYIYHYSPAIKTVFNSVCLKFNEYSGVLDNYLLIVKTFTLLIKHLDTVVHTINEEFIFKVAVNNFVEIFSSFLERNDKTIVKVDQGYFKLGKLKSNSNKKTVSLLQIAKQESSNENLEKYSNKELNMILAQYLNLFVSYMQSDCFRLIINPENKRIINSLVELVIIPPYGKYIYFIPQIIKKSIIELVYNYFKFGKEGISIDQIERFNLFLKAFSSNDEYENILLNQIYDLISKNSFGGIKANSYTDITTSTLNFNQQIAEILKKNTQNLIKSIEEKPIIQTKEIVQNNLLNKKRKNEELNPNSTNTNYKIELTKQEEDIIAPDDTTAHHIGKWKHNNNEFVSKEKIVMILKDKSSFIGKNGNNTTNNNQNLISRELILNRTEDKTSSLPIAIPSSDSDSEMEIEIPDLI